MTSAEILTIGTELLLGEIVDTNAAHIARTLRGAGIDVRHKATVGDNVDRIAAAVRAGLARSDMVIATGGLGPTVDDVTRDAVALALGVDTEFRAELWDQVQERFRRFGREPTINNRRQAYVPAGAFAVVNPVGTAPAFAVESDDGLVVVLPGVPREMRHLLERSVIPLLRERFDFTDTIVVRVLHISGAGESQVDEAIADLEELTNPTVGLAAHPGQVDVRITAKASSGAEAEDLIEPVEADIRKRLGGWVFGADEDALEDVVLRAVSSNGWRMVCVEGALGGRLIQRLSIDDGPLLAGMSLSAAPPHAELRTIAETVLNAHSADVALGVALHPDGADTKAHVVLITPDEVVEKTATFGGHPKHGAARAVNVGLEMLRRAAAT